MDSNTVDTTVVDQPSVTPDINNLKQQISAARNTKTMLENGISALDRCTVPVDYAVKIGILYQFIENVLRQTTADLKTMQDKANG